MKRMDYAGFVKKQRPNLISARRRPRRSLLRHNAARRAVVVLSDDAPTDVIIKDLFQCARTEAFEVFSERLAGILGLYKEGRDPRFQIRESGSAVGQHVSDRLATARQRGAQYALNEWNSPENLSLQAAAMYDGTSANAINLRRRRRQLYALGAPDGSRTFRYPKWQFDVDPDRLRVAMSTFAEMRQHNSWVLHNFLTRPNSDLDDVPPQDYIADPSKELKRLVQVIQRRFSSEAM